jgi:hypothetical protein
MKKELEKKQLETEFVLEFPSTTHNVNENFEVSYNFQELLDTLKREIKFRYWNGKEMVYTNSCITNFPLMQYSGINDINNVEIYEGDIIIPAKFKDVANIVVYLGNGFYRFKKHGEKEYYNNLGNCKVLVIGNIFKNKTIK